MQRNRSGCLIWVSLLALAGFVIYLFRAELFFGRDLLVSLITRQPVETLPELPDAMRKTLFLAENTLAVFFLFFLIWYWTGAAAFPVRDNFQVWQIIQQIFSSLTKRAAPFLMVREGVLVGEVGRSSANAMIVDLESVVVLERQGMELALQSAISAENPEGFPRRTMARVVGPGLHLLRGGERLRDVMSLRMQVRKQENVHAQTLEGIELRTDVSAVFSLGQPPDIVQVAYVGDPEPYNLRVLQIDPETRQVLSIRDELDDQDKMEIHQSAQDFLYYLEPNSKLEIQQKNREAPPFFIEEDRIVAAAYSQARDVSSGQPESRWADLPAMVAADIFRDMISRYTLDDLYLPDNPDRFPLQEEIKPVFARRIRWMGVMAYQIIQRNNEESPRVGERVLHKDYRIAAVKSLRGAKMLRERGIKVIHAGFSELVPTDPHVNRQRVENWRARWQKEADLIRAEMEREVMRIKNHARAEKQREMIETLSSLFKSSAYSEEALSLRIFQALENAASDPYTRQLLSKEALNLLSSLEIWLAPEEKDHPGLLDSGGEEKVEK